jgi:hypothetical protein
MNNKKQLTRKEMNGSARLNSEEEELDLEPAAIREVEQKIKISVRNRKEIAKIIKLWIAGIDKNGTKLEGKQLEKKYIIKLTVKSLLQSGFTREELKVMRHGRQGRKAMGSTGKTERMNSFDKAIVLGKIYQSIFQHSKTFLN